MNMGQRLREMRLSRKISQEEIARHIGITRSAYSHYEINNRQPVYETLIKLAAYFDVSLDYIIEGTPSKQRRELPLTPDNRELLSLFQQMNKEQRKKSIHMLHEFISEEKRTKDNA